MSKSVGKIWCKVCGNSTLYHGQPAIIKCSGCGVILECKNPLVLRMLNEAYRWVDNKLIIEKRNLVRGRAIHPCETFHPTEWPARREYFEGDLRKSAKTLTGKPLMLDHEKSIPGIVIEAAFEDSWVEFLARVDDPEVLQKIREGVIKHCSVEMTFQQLEKVNGMAPRGLEFKALSFIEKMQPGDPLTHVEVWKT